jgi:hypothetical protein
MGHADGHQQSFAQTSFKTRTPFKIRPQTWALRVTLDTVGGGPIVFGDGYPTLLRQGAGTLPGPSWGSIAVIDWSTNPCM